VLEFFLEKLSQEENNAIFKMVCRLCSLHEEKAFKDGPQRLKMGFWNAALRHSISRGESF